MKTRLKHLRTGLLLLFLGPLCSLFFYQIYQAESLNSHPLNLRTKERIELRGTIAARGGQVLASSSGDHRVYPAGEVTAPLVGYWDRYLGRAGLEASYQKLLASSAGEPGEPPVPGRNLRLSLELPLQEQVYEAMADHQGAFLLLDLEDGAVRVSVSRPSFRPGELDQNWEEISTDPNAPLIERVAQGLYPTEELSLLLPPLVGERQFNESVFERLKFHQRVNGYPGSEGGIHTPKSLVSPLALARLLAAWRRGGQDRPPYLVEGTSAAQTDWLPDRAESCPDSWSCIGEEGSWWFAFEGEELALLRLEGSSSAERLGVSILDLCRSRRSPK